MKKSLKKAAIIIAGTIIGLTIGYFIAFEPDRSEEFNVDRDSLIFNGQSVGVGSIPNVYTITLLYESRGNTEDSNYCEFLVTKNAGLEKIELTKKLKEQTYGTDFLGRFSFCCNMSEGAVDWDSKLKQKGNGIIVGSKFKVISVNSDFMGKINIFDWNNIDKSIKKWDNNEIQMLSYLESVSGKSEDGTEVYITPNSIQLISKSLIDIEHISIELSYDDGSKEELMIKGKSDCLINYNSDHDTKGKKYYYKWEGEKEWKVKDIAEVKVDDDIFIIEK